MRLTASAADTTRAFAGSGADMSVMPRNFHWYGGGSSIVAPPPGMYMKRSLCFLYSIVREGIGGRGLSFSVESSSEGVPHRARSNSASFVTPSGTGRPFESVNVEVGVVLSASVLGTGWQRVIFTMISPTNTNTTIIHGFTTPGWAM